jgi:hypothetical protein
VTSSASRSSAVGLALRTLASLSAGVLLAIAAGLVLGEYPFSGPGIQWLAMSGGAGVGAAMAWLFNRIWRWAVPRWMVAAGAVLASGGEMLAVRRDTAPGDPWPPEAWVAVAAAAVVAVYGMLHATSGDTPGPPGRPYQSE